MAGTTGYTGSLKTLIDNLIVGAKSRANHTGTQPTSTVAGLDTALASKVGSDGTILNQVKMTQAAYNALGTPNSTTAYFIVG